MNLSRFHLPAFAALAAAVLGACGGDGSPAAGNVVTVALTPAAAQLQPGASRSFSATVTGTTSLGVEWTVVESAGGVVDAGGTYTAPSTTGTFHVRARSLADPTASATAEVVVTAAGTSPPAAPTGVAAVATSSSRIEVSWTPPAGSDVTGIKVERSTSQASGFSQVGTAGTSVTSFADTGLAASTTYYYRVKATNGGGDSPASAVASATTQASGGPVTPPADVAAALARLANQAIFFDHASVGNGTMNAVESILASATGPRPRRLEIGQGNINATSIGNGVWADHYFLADNGYPLQKMTEFLEGDLGATGLGARLNGLGGVAMMKLCFADFEGAGLTTTAEVDDAFTRFQATMTSLESSYPNLKLVVMTAALRDGGNDLRERFNDRVRAAYAGTGRLFDVADVESNGYRVGGVRALNPDWNRDGGHLTVAGYDAVARALILFLGGLYP